MSEGQDVPLRVVHVYKDYAPVLGGMENHVRVLAEAQAASGHDVNVLVCARGRRTAVTEENGVTVIRAGRLCTLASMPIRRTWCTCIRHTLWVRRPPGCCGVRCRWSSPTKPTLFDRGDSSSSTRRYGVVCWFTRGALSRITRVTS